MSETTRPPLRLVELAELGIDRLSGVGPRKQAALDALGVSSILDLLMHYPRRYLDRSSRSEIGELAEGDTTMIVATVERTEVRRIRGGRTMVNVIVADATGRCRLTFFNQPWRAKQLTEGTVGVFHGTVQLFRGSRQMANPVVDLVGNRTGRILPVYPQSEKSRLTTWELAEWISQSIRRCAPRGISDPIPREVLDRWHLVDRTTATRAIHEPESMEEADAARTRLVFDELLRIQLALVERKRRFEADAIGAAQPTTGGLLEPFVSGLAHELTGAQQRAISEILADLAGPVPMHRLLQGDVGAGKTLVAVAAMLVAVENGRQAALMAPTEVLAEQHAMNIRELLDPLTVDAPDSLFGSRGLRIELLTNRATGADRTRILDGLRQGDVEMVIGTHAVIQDAVEFEALGVVVVDEQHRFGVEQRAALRGANTDGTVPDMLVMTATPIPRTAAMTVYGDLDVSVLDEMPPGRTPIRTSWARTPTQIARAWADVRTEVEAGRQAFVVCPLVEESDKLEASSAVATFEELSADQLSGLRLGLLHGRMSSADKEEVMGDFRDRSLDVLVATTVIEVGVDVPNATMMVVIDADRFGIAQLHQLRGRVGRGDHESSCVLIAEDPTEDAVVRLESLVRTTDGFELAEVDLELRGEGTIMGARQKGQTDLRLASLRTDREWVAAARDVAIELLDDAGSLAGLEELASEVDLLLGDEEEFLFKS